MILGSASFTRTRYAASTVVNGRTVNGATTTSTITGSVQPLTGREVERLPEGVRQRVTLKIYTTAELRARITARPDRAAARNADWGIVIARADAIF
jgi:hypothetical protein